MNEQTLALAGVFQASELVRQAANQGNKNQQENPIAAAPGCQDMHDQQHLRSQQPIR